MKAGDIYYNPRTNHLIEFNKACPFEVVGLEVGIISYHDKISSITLNGAEYFFPTGPLFGMTKSMFRDYKKVGKL